MLSLCVLCGAGVGGMGFFSMVMGVSSGRLVAGMCGVGEREFNDRDVYSGNGFLG